MESALKDLVIVKIYLIPGGESTEEVREFPLEKKKIQLFLLRTFWFY